MKYTVIATTQVTTYLGTTIDHDLHLANFRDYNDAFAFWLEYTKRLENVPCEYHDDNDKYPRKDFWANVTDFCTIWVHLEEN